MPGFPENSLKLFYFYFLLLPATLLLFDFPSENSLLFAVIFLINS